MATDTVTPETTPVGLATDGISQVVEELIDLHEHKVKLLFVRLYESLFVWVGDASAPVLENLSLSIGGHMTTMLEKNPGLISDSAMASRLSAKYNGGRPVYVSFNYAPMATEPNLKLEIDQRLVKFVEKCLQQRKDTKTVEEGPEKA